MYYIRIIKFIIITLICSNVFAASNNTHITDQETGKNIYIQGQNTGTNPITAISAGKIKLKGKNAACANCHRLSGFGSSEGGLLIPSITGKSLFNSREFEYRELQKKVNRPITRTAYTRKSLIKAIRYGIDSNGRTLNTLMPRYNINDDDIEQLVSYLSNLGTTVAPGVNKDIINFATIISPNVKEQDKAAMLSVLNTFIKSKNAGTRLEKRRSTNSPWHKKWSYTSYRKWKLHIWELQGEPDSWLKQLEIFYKNQPVFAVVSGISSGTWQPMHDFCNSQEIPCLFPNTILPGKSVSDINKNNYSIYFSKGIILEAEVIAKHISYAIKQKSCNNVIQIVDNSRITREAAETILTHLTSSGINPQNILLINGTQLEEYAKNNSTKPHSNDCAILWTINSTLNNTHLIKTLNFKRLYITGHESNHYINDKLQTDSNVYITSLLSLPEKRNRHLRRVMIWSKMNKITPVVENITANTYFAVTTLASGVKHIRHHFSRDYLIERLEHSVDNSAFHSVYKRLTLGPGQRYASKGAYIFGPVIQGFDFDNTKNSEWIVP